MKIGEGEVKEIVPVDLFALPVISTEIEYCCDIDGCDKKSDSDKLFNGLLWFFVGENEVMASVCFECAEEWLGEKQFENKICELRIKES